VRHQPADEVNVAAEPIELRNNDRRFEFPSRLQRRRELRSAIEGIRTFTGFDLLEASNWPWLRV
jgi:hypothetical protein